MATGREGHLQSLEEIVTCPICKEIPDVHVTMPCFHSFCPDCVDKLPVQMDESGARSGVQCPLCRGFSVREDIGKHELMHSLLQSYHVAGRQHSGEDEADDLDTQMSRQMSLAQEKPCTQCGVMGAPWHCMQCAVLFCERCSRGHTNLPVCRGHRLELAENLDSCMFEMVDPVVLCEKHPKKELEYNCVTHNTVLCASCHAFNHRGCEINEIEEAIRTTKEKMNGCVETIRKRQGVMNTAIDNLSGKLRSIHDNERKMHALIDERKAAMIARIESEAAAMHEKVSAESRSRDKQITFEKEETECNVSSLDGILAWIAAICEKMRGASLLQELYGRVMPRLASIVESPAPKLPHIDPSLPMVTIVKVDENQPLIGRVDLCNADFSVQSSFRKSQVPFDIITNQITRAVNKFKVNSDCFKLCFHNDKFWLPSPRNGRILIYNQHGKEHSMIILKKVSRPRTIYPLTDDTLIVASEKGLLVMLSNDCESDDQNATFLEQGDYTDVYVENNIIYAIEIAKNQLHIFEPNDYLHWEQIHSLKLDKKVGYHDRVLVNGDEIYVSSAEFGEVFVYNRMGANIRAISADDIHDNGSNTLLCAHDLKQQVLLLNSKRKSLLVANTLRPYTMESFDVEQPWDVCFESCHILHILANNMAGEACIQTFKLD